MHEWALAESVVTAVQEQTKNKENMKVESVLLLFGELQEINREIFDTGLDEFLQDTALPRDIFRFEMEPASFKCNNCMNEWGLDGSPELAADIQESIHFIPEASHAFIKCPHCQSPDFKITKGRGVRIKEIEMVEVV